MTDKNLTYVDHLTEDDIIHNQRWVCMSFLSPEGIMNCSIRGLKIRGVYYSQEEAQARAAELQRKDPLFHVFVGEVGKWLPWDPDPNTSGDQIYQEKQLNDLMIGYKENLEKKAKLEKERADEMKKQGRSDNEVVQHPKGSMQEKLRKKLDQRQKEKELSAPPAKTLENTNMPPLVGKTPIELQIEQEIKELEEKRENCKTGA